MSNYGFPFIFQVVRNENNHKGVSVNILSYYAKVNNSIKGVKVSGLLNSLMGDNTGIFVSGLVNYSDKNCKGVYVSSICNLLEPTNENDSCKGLNVAMLNMTTRSGGWLFQVGIYNNIWEVPEDSKVIQIGVYNRAGDSSAPIINFKNIFKKRRAENPVNLESVVNEVQNE